MRKLTLTLIAVCCILLHVTAQNRTITGQVTDDKNNPLEGVTVTTGNGKTATQTSKNGSSYFNNSFNLSSNAAPRKLLAIILPCGSISTL
jgi:hypothetical protein